MLGAVERILRSFGRARSFHHALLGLGLDEGTAQAIEASLTKLLDFRHCHAEDQLVLEKDERGTLLLFEYHASPTEYYRVERKGDGTYSAEKVSIPIERTRIRGGGTVTNSLGDALSNAGLGRSLAGIFTFALQRNVDFTTQTRSGDTFRIIVDEERIGDRFLGYGDVHALEYSGQRTGTSRAFWYASGKDDDGDFYDDTGRALHGGWLKTPLRFDHISSGFDPKRRHPILKRIMPHNGVDYAASRGTPVWAAADGVVTHAGPKGPNGNLVSIRHGNGYTTHYAHLERIQSGIKPGANVKQRQMIGTVGSTGRSTGPHLHFGLEKGGRFLDAVPVINGPGALLPAGDLAKFRAQQRRLASELERIPIQGRKPGVDTAASTAPTPESSTESPMD
ncbi:MAG: M23 family metallopeptidase [Polyangiales bacterium]